MNRLARTIATRSLLVPTLALSCMASCAVESTTRLRVPTAVQESADAAEGRRADTNRDRSDPTSADRTVTSRVVAEVQPRGTIPYENMTLPLVSPDGRFLATQTGFAPSWESILAEPGATPPDTTRIEIYELSLIGNDPPVLMGAVNEAALLGRSGDESGFIIESPRPNGARWIGRADWETGRVTWLVAEPEIVAAFATIGAGGRLAYSARPVDGGDFDLVVREGTEVWRLEGRGGDWLMPTWSERAAMNVDGTGLFALVLRGDMLDAVHMHAESAEQMRRTIRRLPLASTGATRNVAFQTMNATVVSPVHPSGGLDRLFFFHPSRLRAAVWSPPALPVFFDRTSLAAVPDTADPASIFVVTPKDLLRRPLADGSNRSKLIAGTQIPRATLSAERPYVLLRPSDGVIGLTVMRLLPVSAIADGAP